MGCIQAARLCLTCGGFWNGGIPICECDCTFQTPKDFVFGLEPIWHYEKHRKHKSCTYRYSKLNTLLQNFG